MAEMVKALWGLMIALELAVLLLMAGKGQYRDFPAIFIYLLINLLEVPIIYAVYFFKGFGSWPAYWTAWISQAVIVTARWLAVCELCRNVMGQFQESGRSRGEFWPRWAVWHCSWLWSWAVTIL